MATSAKIRPEWLKRLSIKEQPCHVEIQWRMLQEHKTEGLTKILQQYGMNVDFVTVLPDTTPLEEMQKRGYVHKDPESCLVYGLLDATTAQKLCQETWVREIDGPSTGRTTDHWL